MAKNSSHKSVIAALWLCNLFSPMLGSDINAMLPAIGTDLDAAALSLSMTLVLYSLGNVIFNVLGGRFGDLWGMRRVLLASLLLYLVSAVLVGAAQSIVFLLFLRFMQGVTSAVISCCCTAIGISITAPEKRGRILGILLSAVYLGLTLGPVLGGATATAIGWRWFFLLMLVPGLAAWIVLKLRLEGHECTACGESMDWLGAFLLTAGLSLFALGIGIPGRPAISAGMSLAGIVLTYVFIAQQKKTRWPIVDLSLFGKAEGFGLGLAAMLINYGSTMGLVFFFSLYLQLVHGLSPFWAGVALMAQSLVQCVLSPVCGRLADTFGAEKVSSLGMTTCGVSILCMAALGRETPVAIFYVLLVLLGAGMAMFAAPNMSATLKNVEKSRIAVASGICGSMRTLGALLSTVMASLSVSVYLGGEAAGPETIPQFLNAMRSCMIVFGILNLSGLSISLRRLRYAGNKPADTRPGDDASHTG
ncbi:MAG: MFS transporter [Mailhella sp.]|nr:MFS transporter [Mailhella sp.]